MASGNISVYILTYNEESKIAAALESVLWADEIIVVDSGSTDRTAEIAAGLGARVEQVAFEGFGRLRNRAVELCSRQWIFSLDADERCTPEARDEILSTMSSADALDAYFVPRRNYFMGRWIRHSGWYPDYRQPQLFRKGRLAYTEDPVHEGFEMTGRLGYLKQPIWQFPFENLSQIMAKAERYSTLGVEKLRARGVKGGMLKALIHATAAFLKFYVLNAGFLDGWPGFVIAFYYFEGTFYRYAKLAAEQKGWNRPPASPPGARVLR
jgi:glycosyltransferase involved in cell wall biosynthesis